MQQNLTINKSTFPNIGYLALVNSTNIIVENLELKENGQGLLMAYTSNSRITNNIFTENSVGIWSWFSFNNNLTHNIISKNGRAIQLRTSFNNIVAYNSVTNNSNLGIELYYSFNNTLHSNRIVNNSAYFSSDAGISLYQSYTNTIFHNNFINNQRQVYRSNSWSIWNDGCEGNYWTDYNGTDLDSDGIGDTELPWWGVDSYPLMNRYWNPGDINHDLTVDIFDAVLVCDAYGSDSFDLSWNCHCDIAEPYGVINLFDAVLMASNYGESW